MKTYKRIGVFLLTFCMCFIMILSPLNVHATSIGGGGSARTEDGVCKFYHDDGTEIQASQYTKTQNYFKQLIEGMLPQIQIAKSLFGVVPNGTLESGFQDSAFLSDYLNKYGANTLSGWQEYCKDNYNYNGTTDSIEVSASASDDLHDALKQYLDANTGWQYVDTYSLRDLPPNWFSTKNLYTYVQNISSNMKADELIIFPFGVSQLTQDETEKYYICQYYKQKYDGLVYSSSQITDGAYCCIATPFYNWENIKITDRYILRDNGETSVISDNNYYGQISYCNISGLLDGGDWQSSEYKKIIYTKDGGKVKVFKTFADYKTYSVGKQPYYASSKWQNYVSGHDNSITQNDINGNVQYGDVVNAVNDYSTTNNGITDEQLQAILDAMLQASENGGGSGGSGDSGGGTGLGGLLDGLGAVGNVIMAILGKLLEIVSKALTLLSDTVLNIIDKVPKGFTDLLVAIFPFIPEEWTTAIGLSLVLAVVAGIVGIFKK